MYGSSFNYSLCFSVCSENFDKKLKTKEGPSGGRTAILHRPSPILRAGGSPKFRPIRQLGTGLLWAPIHASGGRKSLLLAVLSSARAGALPEKGRKRGLDLPPSLWGLGARVNCLPVFRLCICSFHHCAKLSLWEVTWQCHGTHWGLLWSSQLAPAEMQH